MFVGTAEELGWSASFSDQVHPQIGLKMKWIKTQYYAPGSEVAGRCRRVLPAEVTIHCEMTLKFLKALVGSNIWVHKQLEIKLEELNTPLDLVNRMSFHHEPFKFSKHCSSKYKVNHLRLTNPLRQLKCFLSGFDAALRKALQYLLRQRLSDLGWKIASLPAKFGGLGLRSGLNVAGAQHVVSQVKSSFEIIRHVTWNLLETTEEATLNRLSHSLGEPVNLEAMVSSIVFKLTHKVVVDRLEYNLSLSLPCELIEQNPIFKMK